MVSKLISKRLNLGTLGDDVCVCVCLCVCVSVCVCVCACGTQASTMTPFLLPNRPSDDHQFADDHQFVDKNLLGPKVTSI